MKKSFFLVFFFAFLVLWFQTDTKEKNKYVCEHGNSNALRAKQLSQIMVCFLFKKSEERQDWHYLNGKSIPTNFVRGPTIKLKPKGMPNIDHQHHTV